MPTIVLQVPSIGTILSQETDNWHQNRSINRCIHCDHCQSVEEEISQEVIKEEIVDEYHLREDFIYQDMIKIEEIKEEAFSQYSTDEQCNLHNYITNSDLNIKESPLSPLSQTNTTEKIHQWEEFPIESLSKKYV